jgi:hypothetical protein
VLVVTVEDLVSNAIPRSALEVCNKRNITQKPQILFIYYVLFYFQKMQRRLHQIMTHCECRKRVVEDVYRTMEAPAGLKFTGADHKDFQDHDLDTTTDILSQLDIASDPTQASQGGRPWQPPYCFTPSSHTVVQCKRGRLH